MQLLLLGGCFGGSKPGIPAKKSSDEEKKQETRQEFASRLTKAFMDAMNPRRERMNKRTRKRLRKVIYRLIMDELKKSPGEKDDNVVPPAQQPLPYLG